MYGGETPMEVRIVGQDYDRNYEMAQEDELEPGQKPMPLGEDGLLYHVAPGGSPLFQAAQAAKDWANQQPWGPVRWNDEP